VIEEAGPFDGTLGSMWKYNITSGAWTNITPAQAIADSQCLSYHPTNLADSPCPDGYGFGGISIDAQKPGVVMAASLNQ
jgi:xyloglucan-specific exo-beta-1,4-glucanase